MDVHHNFLRDAVEAGTLLLKYCENWWPDCRHYDERS